MCNIFKSGEDYLEAALLIEQQKGVIKSIDIANHLGITRATVSKGLNSLIENKYIEKESYGDITLTPLGRKKAIEVMQKHKAVFRLLTEVLGVNPETAEQDACKIEHVLSAETTQKLLEFDDKFTD